MPAVVGNGDFGTSGGTVDVVQQSLSFADGEPRVATRGDLYVCTNKRHSPHAPAAARLLNGCYFNRVHGRQVAIVNVTKATCGCRMTTGSQLYHCCNHLDGKAARLAERAALIDSARNAATDPEIGAGLSAAQREQLGRYADDLERLNRDVRYADASVAAYMDPDSGPRFNSGTGGAPEGMIRLRDGANMADLPASLQSRKRWSDLDSGYEDNTPARCVLERVMRWESIEPAFVVRH